MRILMNLMLGIVLSMSPLASASEAPAVVLETARIDYDARPVSVENGILTCTELSGTPTNPITTLLQWDLADSVLPARLPNRPAAEFVFGELRAEEDGLSFNYVRCDEAESLHCILVHDITGPEPVLLSSFYPPDAANFLSYRPSSIDYDDGIFAIGIREMPGGGFYSGAVYLYDMSDPTNPVQTAKFHRPDSGNEDGFGKTVDLSGVRLLVESQFDDLDFGEFFRTCDLYDISDPAAPIHIANTHPNPFDDSRVMGEGAIALGERFALVATIDARSPIGGSGNGAVSVFDARTGGLLSVIQLNTVFTLPDNFGEYIILKGDKMLTRGFDRTNLVDALRLYDLTDPANPICERVMPLTVNPPRGAIPSASRRMFAWDGADLAVAVRNGVMRVFDAAQPEPPLCWADFDGDGDVDLGDFGVFGAAFGSTFADAHYNARVDDNHDGEIDLGDFGAFGEQFGRALGECAP